MKVGDINRGDIVRFRQWDDMQKQFGSTRGGNIKCQYTFTSGMRCLCGKEYEVDQISPSGEVWLRGFDYSFIISADMLEPAENVAVVEERMIDSILEV